MEKRFMALHFPYLKTDWLTLRRPELAGQPFVFSFPEQNRLVISALNAAAENQGLTINMRLADAKAMLPNLKVLEDKQGREAKLLNAIAEWCIRYTPIVAIDLPDGLLFNVSGCTHLWGGEEPYINEIILRFKSKGYTIRAAIADTVGCAWAMARFGAHQFIIPRGGQKAALLKLPPVALRLDAINLEKLQKMGFRRIGLFSDIPHGQLRRRFGEDILLRLMQAYGDVEEHIKPIQVPEPYYERLPSLEPIRTRIGIEIAVRKLLEMMGQRLISEGKGIRNATLKTYRVDGKMHRIEIGTSHATSHAEHLFKLFDLHLGDIEPDLGIELFMLEANRVENADAAQQALWTTKSGLQDNGILELIDKLAGKVGANAIRRYLPQERYWPERSIKVTKNPTELPQSLWRTDMPRPTQLLDRPEPILVSSPVPDYPPMLFNYKDRVHYIKRADGPERIEREWWMDEGEHRDYYIVEDQHGARYWVFRSGHYQDIQTKWFLHGFFA